MNNLMCFEGHKIGVLKENDNWLFEIYSTGMALGHVKLAKGNEYPRKERIDENIKNAEIKPVVRYGQQYFTESQLYDFMLEAKTEKVKPFRKWLVNEVLPSINHTGTYTTGQQLQLEDKPYEYKPKTYKGIPVVTTADLQHFTGMGCDCFNYQIRRNKKIFLYGVDYQLLSGKDLLEFKQENSNCHSLAKFLTIITESGVKKLFEILGYKTELKEIFQIENKPDTRPRAYFTNSSTKRLLEMVYDKTVAINELSHLLGDLDTLENKEHYRKSLKKISNKLQVVVQDLATIKLI